MDARETTVYARLLAVKERDGAGFFLLLDPDRIALESAAEHARRAEANGVDALLVGTSLMMGDNFSTYVETVGGAVDIPVIIFPGNKAQVASGADAILYLSLLSGRNPELIIGEQAKSAPLIRNIGLEAVSTAYLLVDSGRLTSVEYMSDTKPIPADKPEIAVAHAMAAELLGMKCIYLEAGSGAERPVPDDMIARVAQAVDIPVIVGGGLRTPETVAAKVRAGASFVVAGNHFEDAAHTDYLSAFVRAAKKT